jgi:hypothetical protein
MGTSRYKVVYRMNYAAVVDMESVTVSIRDDSDFGKIKEILVERKSPFVRFYKTHSAKQSEGGIDWSLFPEILIREAVLECDKLNGNKTQFVYMDPKIISFIELPFRVKTDSELIAEFRRSVDLDGRSVMPSN